ncbi:MAG: POTRA domain-containing protein, partial [candidate division NC10 bacterium]
MSAGAGWRGGAVMAALAGLLLAATGAAAQEGETVVAVEVRGTKTVAEETILARVQTKPGSPYQNAVVSEDIRRLFALGYFTDVRADVEPLPEGLRLVFVVTEKPTVAAVEVAGNRVLGKPRILELFGVEPGELHDPRKIKEGIDSLKAEYARKGFSQT